MDIGIIRLTLLSKINQVTIFSRRKLPPKIGYLYISGRHISLPIHCPIMISYLALGEVVAHIFMFILAHPMRKYVVLKK